MVIYQPSPQTRTLTTHSLSIYTALEKVSATAEEDKYVHSIHGAGRQARVLLQSFQPVSGLNFLNKQLEIHELRVVLFGTSYRPSQVHLRWLCIPVSNLSIPKTVSAIFTFSRERPTLPLHAKRSGKFVLPQQNFRQFSSFLKRTCHWIFLPQSPLKEI